MMLEFDAFCGLFGAEFNPDGVPLTPEVGLFDDLALDSFDAFRLLIFLEVLAEVLFPPDDLPEMYTVGDAHSYYQLLCQYASAHATP